MSSIRHLPLGYMVGASCVGALLPRLLGLPRAPAATPLFAGLLALQVAVFAVYAILIYPFYLSPLRHLPSPEGATPFIGHGREMRRYGPGLMARKWCVGPHPPPPARDSI